jgi:hypothetical protein
MPRRLIFNYGNYGDYGNSDEASFLHFQILVHQNGRKLPWIDFERQRALSSRELNHLAILVHPLCLLPLLPSAAGLDVTKVLF